MVKELYQCETCKKEYEDRPVAEKCEAIGTHNPNLPKGLILKIGINGGGERYRFFIKKSLDIDKHFENYDLLDFSFEDSKRNIRSKFYSTKSYKEILESIKKEELVFIDPEKVEKLNQILQTKEMDPSQYNSEEIKLFEEFKKYGVEKFCNFDPALGDGAIKTLGHLLD